MKTVAQTRGFLLFEGFFFALMGIFAILVPGLFTLSLELLVGWILVIGGFLQFFRSFQMHNTSGFFYSLIGSLASILIGILLVLFPFAGMVTLTVFLSAFLCIQGVMQIILAVQWKSFNRWFWLAASGVISIFIALLIWNGLPSTANWVIGLLFGINLLFLGCSQIAFALSLKK